VIRITDYRASVNEIIACRAMKEFLENLTPEHIFCCITHCDYNIPAPDVIDNKIKSFKKWADIEIKNENVILFNNTKESL
jgi:hypothetical protein